MSTEDSRSNKSNTNEEEGNEEEDEERDPVTVEQINLEVCKFVQTVKFSLFPHLLIEPLLVLKGSRRQRTRPY